MTQITPTTTITLNLIESPFKLIHALDTFKGTKKQVKLPNNKLDEKIKEFLDSIGYDKQSKMTDELKNILDLNEKVDEKLQGIPYVKVAKQYIRKNLSYLLETGEKLKRTVVVLPTIISNNRDDIKKYTKYLKGYIDFLKRRRVLKIFFLQVIPVTPISVSEYDNKVKQEFQDLKNYLSNKYIEFKLKLSKNPNATIEEYINSIIFFTDQTFTKLDVDLIGKNVQLKSNIIERELESLKKQEKIGEQILRKNNLSGFNERVIKQTFMADINSIHKSIIPNNPSFSNLRDKYNILYDFFIHVLKILDEKFKKTYDTTTGKPTFNVIFRKKYDPQNKDVMSSNSLFKISTGRSQIYELKLSDINFTINGYLETNKSQSNRYKFKHTQTSCMLYEMLYKFLYGKTNTHSISYLISESNSYMVTSDMLKKIYGIDNISSEEFERIKKNQKENIKKRQNNSNAKSLESKYNDYMTNLKLNQFLLDYLNNKNVERNEYILSNNVFLSALLQSENLHRESNLLLKKLTYKNQNEIEDNRQFLKVMLTLGQSFDIQTKHYSPEFEQDEVLVEVIDIKKNITLYDGFMQHISQKVYFDTFLATNISLNFPDKSQFSYRDDLLITEELLKLYYNSKDSTLDREIKKKKDNSELNYSKMMMELLVDMEKYNHLFEFVMADNNLSKKHILQLNIDNMELEKFKSNVLLGIINILFREGTPFYVTQRQTQTTKQSTGQNISHIMSHTFIEELMNAFKLPKSKKSGNDKFEEFLKEHEDIYRFRSDKKTLRGTETQLQEHEKKLLTLEKLKILRSMLINKNKDVRKDLFILDVVVSRKFNSLEDKRNKRRKCNNIRKRMEKTLKRLRTSMNKGKKRFNVKLKKMLGVKNTTRKLRVQ